MTLEESREVIPMMESMINQIEEQQNLMAEMVQELQERDRQLLSFQEQNQSLQILNSELSGLLNLLPDTEELLSQIEQQKVRIEQLENENQQWQELTQKLNNENSLLLKQSRELLVCMITYTLLASLTVTSFLSMVVTRFIADMLYEEKNEAVLSSFWGSTGLMLIAGGILYGIFLIFSGVGLIDKFLCFELFGELIVTWNAMSYLTAIKDYRGIMLSFLAAIAVTFLSGALLLFLGISMWKH